MAAGPDTKEYGWMEQLFRGIGTGIEGGIHAMQLIRQKHSQEEDWGFVFIDARNDLNKDN